VADNVESNAEYKQYKREMTGVSWDYDMSKLYLFYSPDIRKEDFRPYAIVSDKSATRGWVRSEDCCFDQNGDMLFLISAENVHFGFMRDRFFPEQPLETVLKVCRFSHGELIEETIVDRYMEENDIKVYYGGYFHTAENGEIYIVWSKENSLWNKPGDHRGDEGIPAVENAAVYLSKADELDKEPIKIFDVSGRIFGNKTRLGAEPGNIIDLYSYREDKAIYYSRCDLEYILER